MARALLIYDGDCAYCRGLARLASRLDRGRELALADYDQPEVQALLRAQFGDGYGLAMYCFQPGGVAWGSHAAERVALLLGAPPLLGRLVYRFYPRIVWGVSRLSRRARPVCGPDCAGQEAGREVPLRPEAVPLFTCLLGEQQG